jgi:SAM-dependent methyltransferase
MAVEKYDNDDTKRINNHQKTVYEKIEKDSVSALIVRFSGILSLFKEKTNVKILDIGGASGNFAGAVYEFINTGDCEITVIDTEEYDTWNKHDRKIKFVKMSANNVSAIFGKNTFDLVFANRAFHHFVKTTWKKTIDGIDEVLTQIKEIIKPNGYLCITEHFFDGLLFDNMSSKIVYTISSCKYKSIINICEKSGVESAGIGACFLPKRMWINLLRKNKFRIENIEKGTMERIKRWYIKILFLNKRNILDNIIIARQNEAPPASVRAAS